MGNTTLLIVIAAVMFAVIGGITLASHLYNLNGIKSKTVGDGQHGTARFATKSEIRRTYRQVPFTPSAWRRQAKKNQPPKLPQGIIVGCKNKGGETVALVDDADVHCMMVGAAGCGKTAYWLYPNLEYACASGMSFLATDTKGDLYRNYGRIAQEDYHYNVAVIDLRNPTQSDGNNLLHLVNKYMDAYKENPNDIALKARAEKYAKIIAKTLIYGDGDASAYGQNAFFYDAAEGLMTSVILLIAEFAEPKERHIVSVFKLATSAATASAYAPREPSGRSTRRPTRWAWRWCRRTAAWPTTRGASSARRPARSRRSRLMETAIPWWTPTDATAAACARTCARRLCTAASRAARGAASWW